MTDTMYPTRRRWYHMLGVARHDGVSVDLRAAPVLPGVEGMTELDFIPLVVSEIRIGCGAVRDITAHERVAAQALLLRMAGEARAVFN